MDDLRPGILDLLARLAPAAPPAPPPSPAPLGGTPVLPGPPAAPSATDAAAGLRERLIELPLDAFAKAGHCLEVRVPWAPDALWFVPTEADAETLAREGIHRGRIWTATELRDVLAIPGITKAQARTIAQTKLAVEGDMVAVELTAAAARPAGTPSEPAALSTGSGWPAAVQSLGPKCVGPFTPCSQCGIGTWVIYGEAPRCRACATDAIAASRTRGEAVPER